MSFGGIMTLILKQIFQLVKMLNSETATGQIAAGVALGFILGMTPSLSLQSLLVFILLFLFRVQIGAAFLSCFFFKLVAYVLDPAFDHVGYAVLTRPNLQNFFTTLYNMPIVPYTRFNNTIVMGSGLVAIVLSPLVYLLAKNLIGQYRVQVVERFKGTKLWKLIQATRFYQWYYQYDKFFGSN